MAAPKKKTKKKAPAKTKKKASKQKPGTNGELPLDGEGTSQDLQYPAKAIAEMLGITDRHLRRLASEGVVPKATRGRYPLKGCVRGYIEHLQKVQASAEKRTQEHTRLNAVRADTYELDLQKKRGELYDRETVDEALFQVMTLFIAMLDGSASRISGKLGGGATLRNKLVDEFRNIREQLATGLREFSELVETGSWNRATAAKPKSRRVVKKKSTSKGKR